jgi:hypothetical protein
VRYLPARQGLPLSGAGMAALDKAEAEQREAKLGSALEAALRLLLDGFQDDPFQRRRDAPVELPGSRWRLQHVGVHQCVVAAPLEGQAPGDRLEQADAHRVDVRACIGFAAVDLFGRDIEQRTDHRARRPAVRRVGQLGDAKIHELHALVAGEEDVARLEIAVNHAIAVYVLHAEQRLFEQAQGLGHRQRAGASQALGQGLPRCVLEHEDLALGQLEKRVERDDVRMVEARLGARLGTKTADVFWVAAQMRGQDLERHDALQLGVERPVYDPHAPAAQPFEDTEAMEHIAGPPFLRCGRGGVFGRRAPLLEAVGEDDRGWQVVVTRYGHGRKSLRGRG